MKLPYWLLLPGLQLLTVVCFAQLDRAQKSEAIDSIVKELKDRYVFPEVAGKMEAHLRQLQKAKAYDTITNGDVFAQRLTEDLRSISRDKHISIGYSVQAMPPEQERELLVIPDAEKEGFNGHLKYINNYGIRKLDVLKGNIGYLDIELFCPIEFAGHMYASAMNYLAHTDALIIDLRNCGGSISPDAIPFFCSYFFEAPVHLSDLYWRKGNITVQGWTSAYVHGQKYLNKPIYILTSGKTFSGGEGMAYDLQQLKRATIIGQKTGGGANPGGFIRVNPHFRMFIPVGRAINPITKTNWEGIGVQPDTVIHRSLALYKARQMATQYALQIAKAEGWKEELKVLLQELEATKPILKPVTFTLDGFANAKTVYVAGTFNDWTADMHAMQRVGNRWLLTTEAEPGKIKYKFIVDGLWITDPGNPHTEANGPHTDSVKVLE